MVVKYPLFYKYNFIFDKKEIKNYNFLKTLYIKIMFKNKKKSFNFFSSILVFQVYEIHINENPKY